MRLIRLTTKELQGIFDCTFNSDIVIQPNSKIALHSFTTQLNRFELDINSQNDKITFTVDGEDSIKTISLPNGIWNSGSIETFFTLATQIFNKEMEYTTNQIGRQWYVGCRENRFTFQCMAGSIINPASSKYTKFKRLQNTTNAGTGSPFIWRRSSGGTVGQNDSFIYFKTTQCKGAGSYRAKLLSDPNPATAGFILAYTSSPVSEETTVIDPSIITYGIRYVDTTQVYKYYVNGAEASSGITPAYNDILTIDTYQGHIYLNIYRSDGTNNIFNLYTGDYDHITNYFPLSIFPGTTRVGGIIFTTDYYYNQSNPPSETDDLHVGSALPPISNNTLTNNFLEFDDILLAQDLGYTQFRYPLIGYNLEVNSTYTGYYGFKLRDYTESYIIEMLNMNIDSYDSLTAQRRNFLSVIPQFSTVREQVVYTAPVLIWLDLNISSPLLMRQFRARILKEDLTQVDTFGQSQMTILIKGPNEA